jgi:hypothetical protein
MAIAFDLKTILDEEDIKQPTVCYYGTIITYCIGHSCMSNL